MMESIKIVMALTRLRLPVLQQKSLIVMETALLVHGLETISVMMESFPIMETISI